jgi:signal transduction histidine kinase
MAADPAGGMWLGLLPTGLVLYRGGVVKRYTTADGLGTGGVSCIFLDSRGLWAASSAGLVRLKDGRVDRLTVGNGLPCNKIDSAVTGDDGALWLKASCGLVRIESSELDAWSDDPRRRIRVRLLDVWDGVEAGVSPFSPRAARSADGRLWFIIESGVQLVDPRRLKLNPIVPPVHIQGLKVNGKPQELALAPNPHNIEIDYTALSLSIPERVLFRYKLEGADADWQDAGARRQAFYSRLAPNRYRFRVIACNNDGLWNEAGASLDFSVAPALYQTSWFRFLCGLAGASAVWLLYRMRLNQVTARVNHQYQGRLSERTRIARELHDTLLQSLAGVSLQLEGISKKVLSAPSDAVSQIRFVREQVDTCFREARLKVWELRSPELEVRGLLAMLRAFVERVNPAGRISCEFSVTGKPRACPPEIEEELFRIAQEAVNNAIRHADPTKIRVLVAYEGSGLRLQISDNGCGFDLETGRRREGHWGLKNMQDRAAQIGATYNISSVAEHGTDVEVCFNFSKRSRHARSNDSHIDRR